MNLLYFPHRPTNSFDQRSTYYPLTINKCRKNIPKKISTKNSELDKILNQTLQKARFLKNYQNSSIDSVDSLRSIIIKTVIPIEYFGCNYNQKLFNRTLKKLFSLSKCEFIYRSELYDEYKLEKLSWLPDQENNPKLILRRYNEFILNKVVKPLVNHFFYLYTGKQYEIKFIKRRKWQKFYSLAWREMRLKKNILSVPKTVNPKSKGLLYLKPKGETLNEVKFRPIVFFKFSETEKRFMKTIKNNLIKECQQIRILCKPSTFHQDWKTYQNKSRDDKLYGIKFDIKNAFGQVDLNLLIKYIKNSKLPQSQKMFVIDNISNQYVHTYKRQKDISSTKLKFKRKKLFLKWNCGLLQGHPLSSCLCDYYLINLEREVFTLAVQRQLGQYNTFFYRVADDYFFCCTDKETTEKIPNMLAPKFKEGLNCEKTTLSTNKFGEQNLIYINGLALNIETKEVKKHFDLETCNIRHRFRLWNPKYALSKERRPEFIHRTMRFCYNNMAFPKIVLCTTINRISTVMENLFEGFVYIAFKFYCLYQSLYGENTSNEQLCEVIQTLKIIIANYCRKLYSWIIELRGPNYKEYFTYPCMKCIFYKAICVVFKFTGSKDLCEIAGKMKESYAKKYYKELEFDWSKFNKLPKPFKSVKFNRKN